MQAAYRNVQKNFGSLSSVNNEDLLKEIERNKQEISEKNIRKPDKKFDWNNNELYDPETELSMNKST